MRILVTGSRDWHDPRIVYRHLFHARMSAAIGEKVTVVHGHCRTGADHYADLWATEGVDPDVSVERHPADWAQYGKRAGFLRNAEMVQLGADVVLAFIRKNSKGATHTVNLANKAGLIVQEFHA